MSKYRTAKDCYVSVKKIDLGLNVKIPKNYTNSAKKFVVEIIGYMSEDYLRQFVKELNENNPCRNSKI